MSRIDYRSFDGRKTVQIGNGRECVMLMIDETIAPGTGVRAGVVLKPKEARRLAKGLKRQAKYSERP